MDLVPDQGICTIPLAVGTVLWSPVDTKVYKKIGLEGRFSPPNPLFLYSVCTACIWGFGDLREMAIFWQAGVRSTVPPDIHRIVSKT